MTYTDKQIELFENETGWKLQPTGDFYFDATDYLPPTEYNKLLVKWLLSKMEKMGKEKKNPCSTCNWEWGKSSMTGIGSSWPCDGCRTDRWEALTNKDGK